MTERNDPSTPNAIITHGGENSSRRSFLAFLVGAVAGIGAGGAGATSLKSNLERNNDVRQRQSQAEKDAASLASVRATEFTSQIYDQAHYPKGVPLPVVNGALRTVTGRLPGSSIRGIVFKKIRFFFLMVKTSRISKEISCEANGVVFKAMTKRVM